MTKSILIVGAGSVGKRHARNLIAEGCKVAFVDPREDRRSELAGANVTGSYGDVETALKTGQFDGAVIASPPSFHIAQSQTLLSAGLPLFLEKPVCPTLAEARKLEAALKQSGKPLVLGYTWRWWPPFTEVWRHLNARTIGDLRYVKFTLSAHLADWHPYERYQDFFMASATLGGGALLDESHWIDLLLWFFGEPDHITARIEKISSLEIDTDDNVDMLISYASGLRVGMHLDLYGRPHEKHIQFSGENGTMRWSEAPNEVAVWSTESNAWTQTKFEHERNDMFVGAIREYLSVLSGKAVKPTCQLSDGITVLRIIEAARRSSDEGRRVALAEIA